MACHEIAALRLGMMNMLGRKDPSEIRHELAELGELADKPGPLQNLAKSSNHAEMSAELANAVGELEQRVALMANDDPEIGYYRTLLVTTRRVEGELASHRAALERMFEGLDESHHLIHELFPAS